MLAEQPAPNPKHFSVWKGLILCCFQAGRTSSWNSYKNLSGAGNLNKLFKNMGQAKTGNAL